MTLSEIYRKYLLDLKTIYSQNEASEITSMAFEALADVQRSDVIKYPATVLPDETVQTLERALIRLKQHEPIQYITEQAWFCNLAFKVSRAVLVPRPETEELVRLVSAFLQKQRLGVLDIGTGSACIPIALLVKNNEINVTAIDVSEEALEIAKYNAALHNCPIECKQIDFLDESWWMYLEKTDVIVSNPPYIPEVDKELLDTNVSRYEPHLALFEPSGQALIFYHKIAKFAKTHLNEEGKIFVEIHEDFGKQVLQIFIDAGYEAELKKDMFGKDRFVVAEKSEPKSSH